MEIENFESVKRWRNNLKGGKYERALSCISKTNDSIAKV